MEKVTKKQLEQQINLLSAENSEQHEYLMRIKRALKSIDIDILSEEFAKTEPKLKVLDQSVFNGLDEKWRFAAVDSNGECWLYANKPSLVVVSKNWIGASNPICFANGYDASDWKNSLIERDKVELTGSDLARAMLERGDKYVMCLVSDMSHAGAISNCSKPRLIVNHEVMGFIEEPKDLYWHFAVPINNQGEPLTQSEAGL